MNLIQPIGTPSLCSGYKLGLPRLQVLNLTDTSLGNKGVTQVAVALAKTAPLLEELDLALNEISGSGVLWAHAWW
jgi:hypothetical protein